MDSDEYWDYAVAKTEEIGARSLYRCPPTVNPDAPNDDSLGFQKR